MTVKTVVHHPKYISSTLTNDIAMVKLSSPVALTDNVNTVCLPSRSYSSGDAYVTGWGDTMTGGKPGKRDAGFSPESSPQNCTKRPLCTRVTIHIWTRDCHKTIELMSQVSIFVDST